MHGEGIHDSTRVISESQYQEEAAGATLGLMALPGAVLFFLGPTIGLAWLGWKLGGKAPMLIAAVIGVVLTVAFAGLLRVMTIWCAHLVKWLVIGALLAFVGTVLLIIVKDIPDKSAAIPTVSVSGLNVAMDRTAKNSAPDRPKR
jgi:hypothetical protein